MGRHLGMSQVLPVLRLSKKLPTLGGIVRGLLTVQRTHGAVASNIFHYLCLPQIKPEHIGDAVHPGSDGTECAPLPRRHVISERPCSTLSECACLCSSPCRTAAHGADGVRRTPRYGSSRSTVQRMRFARVNAETSGGLECRSIERGG